MEQGLCIINHNSLGDKMGHERPSEANVSLGRTESERLTQFVYTSQRESNIKLHGAAL